MQSGVNDFQIANGHLSRPAEEYPLTVYAAGGAVALSGSVICRLAGPLNYTNAELFMNDVLSFVRDARSTIRWFILQFDAINEVDYVAAKMLMELADRMRKTQAALVFADLSKEVKDFLSGYGVIE